MGLPHAYWIPVFLMSWISTASGSPINSAPPVPTAPHDFGLRIDSSDEMTDTEESLESPVSKIPRVSSFFPALYDQTDEFPRWTLIGKGQVKKVYRVEHSLDFQTAAYQIEKPFGVTRSHEKYKQYLRLMNELEIYRILKDMNGVVKSQYEIKSPWNTWHHIEYFPQGDLRSYVEGLKAQGRGLSSSQVFQVTRNTCQTLSEMHDLGVIHKDIKPSNIFVRSVDEGKSEIVTVIGDFDQSFRRGDDLDSKGFDRNGTTIAFADPHYLQLSGTLDPNKKEDFQMFKEQDYFGFGMTVIEIIKKGMSGWPQSPVWSHSFLGMVALLEFQGSPLEQERKQVFDTLTAQPDANRSKIQALRELLDCALNLDLSNRCYNFKELCSRI